MKKLIYKQGKLVLHESPPQPLLLRRFVLWYPLRISWTTVLITGKHIKNYREAFHLVFRLFSTRPCESNQFTRNSSATAVFALDLWGSLRIIVSVEHTTDVSTFLKIFPAHVEQLVIKILIIFFFIALSLLHPWSQLLGRSPLLHGLILCFLQILVWNY